MTRGSEWLEGYLRAWASKSVDDVRALFTDEAEYWQRPDDPSPAVGIEAILDLWVDPEPTEPVPALAVLIEREDLAIITGTVDYPGHASYSNMWEVWFAPDGRCSWFVEWYMTPPGPGQ